MLMGISDNEWERLVKVYHQAYTHKIGPCAMCETEDAPHFHATCCGAVVCHTCYLERKPVTQCYPGDWGGSAFIESFGDKY